MIRVGIECEQLEQNRFGIGHTLAQFFESLTKIPDIEKELKLVLYFKATMPTDAFLTHPLFEKKVLMQGRGLFNVSFNVFYHILLPLRYWKDTIDVFVFPSNMLPAFFLGKAIVVLVSDVPWEAFHGTLPFRYRLSYILFCWWAARRATIMTISEVSKRELQQFYGIPDRRIFVNPWGIDPLFNVLARDEAYIARARKIREHVGITGDFFLSVGQAFPRRHVKETMEAFALIADEYPGMQYLVACTDKYNPPMLVQLAGDINKKLGREAIVLSAYLAREDMPYCMNESRALVYVSSKEAQGLPPVEALACGTPVIVADTPISHEIFGDDGFFVSDPSRPAEIAVQMRRLLKNPAESMRVVRAQTPNLARYGWQAHIERWLAMTRNMSA